MVIMQKNINKNQCFRCLKKFTTNQRLNSHLNRKIQCQTAQIEVNSKPIIVLKEKKNVSTISAQFSQSNCAEMSTISAQFNPVNVRKTPENSRKSPENSRKTDIWPENSRKTPENIRKTNLPANARKTEKLNYFENGLHTVNSRSNLLNNGRDSPNLQLKNQKSLNEKWLDELEPMDYLIIDKEYGYKCKYCQKTYGRRFSAKRHIKNGCDKMIKEMSPNQTTKNPEDEAYLRYKLFNEKISNVGDLNVSDLNIGDLNTNNSNHNTENNIMNKFSSLEQRLIELEKRPSINQNNYLQVVCVNSNDNYLDMLSQKIGFVKALDFVQNCALSGLNGDCRMIEKIFIETDSMRCLDKNRVKIEYYDENEQKVIDIRGVILSGKLASSLQKTYIKGVNFLINDTIDHQQCPLKFLGDYDIQTWNTHIYGLSDLKYQRKLFNHINIPFAS